MKPNRSKDLPGYFNKKFFPQQGEGKMEAETYFKYVE